MILLQAILLPRKVKHCESINAHQALNFFDFWEALEKDLGKECIPFWGAVWPGAKSLARYIIDHKYLVSNKTVLDFGCGSGIVSIASALLGARKVIANDFDPVALYIAKKNFQINGVNVQTESENLLNHNPATVFDLIFVVDMFYERSTSDLLMNFLFRQIESGAEVIIADGNRPFAPQTRTVQLFKEDIEVDMELEGVSFRTVRIMKLR
ncbi:MAG TPA: 50S ribosomal protein L11 methyltransferase [Chitinispirillaceae bacterium]|nr:50S ribosomal protein L11 methyltransferase [Chitinispirillaceae bacterium]